MRNKKYYMTIYAGVFFIFYYIFSNYYYLNVIDNNDIYLENKTSLKKADISISKPSNIESDIRNRVKSLDINYKIRSNLSDNISTVFIDNTKRRLTTDLNSVWISARGWVVENQLFSNKSILLGSIIDALKTAKIIAADTDSRGSQLKLLLKLEKGQLAVFKPQWYPIDRVITGPVYSGKDRFFAEIVAFYLSGILDFRSAPIAVVRNVHIEKEIVPVATKRLVNTIEKHNKTPCVYGVCHYCRREEPACEGSNGLRGALILHVPGKLQLQRSPWQRTYKKNHFAEWQMQSSYCVKIKQSHTQQRLLDLIDVSIFDFLTQNGDRHHYETLNNRVVLLDNGKGFGNPNVHHLDILAPLYQCCILRSSTWSRLKILSGGRLTETLKAALGTDSDIITQMHLDALEERLLLIYSAIELCFDKFKNKRQIIIG